MNLATARMRLHPIGMDDRDLLLALDADPEVMRFLTGGRPSTRDEVEETISASVGSRWLGFLITPPKDLGNLGDLSGPIGGLPDNFVGWFGLGPGPGQGDRQLGYRLRRSMWGKGLATEGAMAMVDHGFDELGANRVWAQTMTVNTASQQVMQRCGLNYRRTFHLKWDDPIDGAELGDVEYELTRADWAAMTP